MRPSAFCLPFILLCGASLAQIISFPLSAQQETREPEAATGLYQQQLVSAKHYMVSAAHPMATQAGLNVLAKGGSAVDAAIAVQLMLGLVEPQSSGIGGGAFMLHWQAKQQKLTSFDGREVAPAAADANLFRVDGKTLPKSLSLQNVGISFSCNPMGNATFLKCIIPSLLNTSPGRASTSIVDIT